MGIVFLMQLAAGCIFFAAVCRRDHIAARYPRLISWVTIGLLAGAVAGEALDGALHSAVKQPATAALLAIALVWAAMPRGDATSPPAGRGAAARAVQTAAVLLIAFAIVLMTTRWQAPWQAWPALLTGALLVGGASASMLLGHAYLTQTQMPIDPFMRLTRLLAAVLLVKAAWAGGILWLDRAALIRPTADQTWLMLMLSVRVAVGLLGLGVLVYMIHDCVKRRSTQSATGILYIAMIFAFFGELTAMELGRRFGFWV